MPLGYEVSDQVASDESAGAANYDLRHEQYFPRPARSFHLGTSKGSPQGHDTLAMPSHSTSDSWPIKRLKSQL